MCGMKNLFLPHELIMCPLEFTVIMVSWAAMETGFSGKSLTQMETSKDDKP